MRMLLAVSVLTLFSASPAMAVQPDNPAIASVPAIGSTSSSAPSSVTVVMKRGVGDPVALVVRDPNGKIVSADRPTFMATNIATDLDVDLTPGVYTVTYRLETADGPEGGTFEFAYRSGSPAGDLKTWATLADVPADARLPSDPGVADGEAPSEGATAPTGTPTPAVPPGTDPTLEDRADASAEASASQDDSSHAAAWIIAGVVLLALLGGLAVWWRKRTAATPDGHL